MPAKVLMIAFDSADPAFLGELIDAGELPALKSLRESGVSGPVAPPHGLGSDAYWRTIQTGVSPATHGVHFIRQITPGSYIASRRFPSDTMHPPFWAAAASSGFKLGLIDFPHSARIEGVEGIQVFEWGTHDAMTRMRASSKYLEADIKRRFGTDKVGPCDGHNCQDHEYRGLLDRLLERIENKAALLAHYLDQDRWDLFATAFHDSHCAGHQMWHIHDTEHVKHNPALLRALGDPILQVYKALDAGLARVIKAAGPEASVVFVTGPGMRANYTANGHIDEILRRLEGTTPSKRGSAINRLRAIGRKALPTFVRLALYNISFGFHERALAAERSQRKCFAIFHNDISGAVRVNLVGREPNGKINPGAEYDRFCTELTADLMDIVNGETGKPLVEEVVRTADLFEGDYLDHLPDLMVMWRHDSPVHTVKSAKIGEVHGTYRGNRTGDHNEDCLFIVSGKGIAPRRLNDAVDAADLAPTVAALAGISGVNVEGKPIADVCGHAG
ncbi:MAG: alkaline phosphatase family protein [Gammaproteobacteria bacterium]|nr:alkaline phosphatase family protein [Gammaproteobacteria bacterium]